jgi:hypothetical protein
MAQKDPAPGQRGQQPGSGKNSGKRGYQAPSVKREQKLAQVTGAVKVTGGPN